MEWMIRGIAWRQKDEHSIMAYDSSSNLVCDNSDKKEEINPRVSGLPIAPY